MRFLFDQSTDRRLVPYFRERAHDVTIVGVDHPADLPDEVVLAIARAEHRVLVTEDKDFGDLVFLRGQHHTGVLLLRLPPMEMAAKVERVDRVLTEHGDRLHEFIVVTPQRIRVRGSSSRSG